MIIILVLISESRSGKFIRLNYVTMVIKKIVVYGAVFKHTRINENHDGDIVPLFLHFHLVLRITHNYLRVALVIWVVSDLHWGVRLAP